MAFSKPYSLKDFSLLSIADLDYEFLKRNLFILYCGFIIFLRALSCIVFHNTQHFLCQNPFRILLFEAQFVNSEIQFVAYHS